MKPASEDRADYETLIYVIMYQMKVIESMTNYKETLEEITLIVYVP